jgi:PleD family two-component response regulator
MHVEDQNDPTRLRELLDGTRDELDRLRLMLDVLGTVDLETGILNRNGLLESLERGRRWMSRRGDIFGAMVVRFPDLPRLDPSHPDDLETIKHLAATIGAGVREVDEVGRLDDVTFAASLADLNPGAIHVVADRVGQMLTKTSANRPEVGPFRIGAVEVLNAGHLPAMIVQTCEALADNAEGGHAAIGQI